MFPMVPDKSEDPIVGQVFDRLRKRWGRVLHLYRILAWSPELVRSWAAFAWSLRFDLKASRKLRELMIIRIAGLLGAQYEYQHHLHMALDEGVTAAQVAALANWRESDVFDLHERAVLALGDDLALKPGAEPRTMADLRALFDERICVELVVTGSFYCAVARIVNSTQVTLEADHAALRAHDERSDAQ